RDQLLGLGFKTAPKPERKPERKPAPGKPPQGGQRGSSEPARADSRPRKPRPHAPDARKPGPHKPRTREDIDLAKAYAIRAQRKKDERIEAERLKQEDARKRREAK